MKKIAIFTDNLKVGGIQKSVKNLTERLGNKYEIDLYLFDEDNFYELPKNINVIYNKKPSKIIKFIPFEIAKRILKIDVLKKEYDLSIDFDSYQMHTAVGALSCNSKKKVIWIHNDIVIKLKEEIKYKILYFFFKKKYDYFDAYCAVSKGALDSFMSLKYDDNKEYAVIPNYIDTEEIKSLINEPCDLVVDSHKVNIVSVGRLCHQKGYDLMIQEIAQLKKLREDFHLYIIGDGPLKDYYKEMVAENELSDYITFLGNQKNPFKFLNKMDLFYLSSRYEGQGMVILEAQACGLDTLIPSRLEKYCSNVKGVDNTLEFLKNYQKKKTEKKLEDLKDYNDKITEKLNNLISMGRGKSNEK